MKKTFIAGFFSPHFYYLAVILSLCTEYSEKYATLQRMLFESLLILPGVTLIFLLERDSLKNYFEALGKSVLISFFVMVMYELLRIEQIFYVNITGAEELGMGEGLLIAIAFVHYLCACLIGSVIAGVISFFKQTKARKVYLEVEKRELYEK